MIISIRYISPMWHWEVYTVGREAAHTQFRYSQGMCTTWKEMISNIEVSVSELEKRDEKQQKN